MKASNAGHARRRNGRMSPQRRRARPPSKHGALILGREGVLSRKMLRSRVYTWIMIYLVASMKGGVSHRVCPAEAGHVTRMRREVGHVRTLPLEEASVEMVLRQMMAKLRKGAVGRRRRNVAWVLQILLHLIQEGRGRCAGKARMILPLKVLHVRVRSGRGEGRSVIRERAGQGFHGEVASIRVPRDRIAVMDVGMFKLKLRQRPRQGAMLSGSKSGLQVLTLILRLSC